MEGGIKKKKYDVASKLFIAPWEEGEGEVQSRKKDFLSLSLFDCARRQQFGGHHDGERKERERRECSL